MYQTAFSLCVFGDGPEPFRCVFIQRPQLSGNHELFAEWNGKPMGRDLIPSAIRLRAQALICEWGLVDGALAQIEWL